MCPDTAVLGTKVRSTMNSSRFPTAKEHTKRTQGNAGQRKATHARQATPKPQVQHRQPKTENRSSPARIETTQKTDNRQPKPAIKPLRSTLLQPECLSRDASSKLPILLAHQPTPSAASRTCTRSIVKLRTFSLNLILYKLCG